MTQGQYLLAKERGRTALWNIKAGGTFFAVGLFVTVATYSQAEAHGGRYLLMYGPLGCGGFWLLVGMVQWAAVEAGGKR
jgi:hypothetical protein